MRPTYPRKPALTGADNHLGPNRDEQTCLVDVDYDDTSIAEHDETRWGMPVTLDSRVTQGRNRLPWNPVVRLSTEGSPYGAEALPRTPAR
jgi:hypothetical protein